MPAAFQIRRAQRADFGAIADVMFDAVRNGKSCYTEAQRCAWVPHVRSGDAWTQRLDSQQILVSETPDGITGCMSLAAEGYIDLAYIRPQAQGTGTFRRLVTEIERIASDNGIPRLWVHASLMAQPAFSAVGFKILRKETVAINDLPFERIEMEKTISQRLA